MSLLRSALYLPASNPRAMAKAPQLNCDVILYDLEDAVAPEDKILARDALALTLARPAKGLKVARINGLDTPWGEADLCAVASDADAILVPKVSNAAEIDAVAELGKPVWAMIETARGVLNASEIADHPAIAGLVLGSNDLAKDLRCAQSALGYAAQAVVLAARAAGCAVFDGVHNQFRDLDGLRAACLAARAIGFDGKSLIHPAQIDIANEVFAPTEAELDLARRQVAAFDAVTGGIAVVDGAIVEALHVEQARELLAQAELIENRNKEQD